MSLIPEAFPEPGLWISVWRLLRLRILILISGFRRAKIGVKIRYIIAGIFLLAILGLFLFISISLLDFLRSPELIRYIGDSNLFLESIPTMMVSSSALGILVTGFGVLLQVMYLSGDMDFLMSAPIPIRAVFIAKMVQAVLPNFCLISAVTLPILYGLGIANGYSVLYYPMVLVVLVILSLAAASLAGLLVMVAARIFPARRLAEVLGFVVGITVFILSQSMRFYTFEVNSQQVSHLLNLAARFNQPWSPLAWAGQGLVDLGKGTWLPAIFYLSAAILLTSAVFYIALSTSERLYYTGWSSLQNNRRRQKAITTTRPSEVQRREVEHPLARLILPSIRAILAKDWLVYRRDLRNLSRLLTPLILGIVYAVSMLQAGGKDLEGQGEAPAWFMNVIQGIVVYGDAILALFLGWMLIANLAGVAFSQEGKYYWILKASPISSRQLLTAKFLVAYLPTMILCGIYLIVLEMIKGVSLWPALVSLIAVALPLAGLTGIYLAFGIRMAKFDWENPSQMGRSVGCLGTIAGILFLAACFGLFIAPPFLFGLFGFPVFIGQIIGLLFGSVASLAAVIIPRGLIEKRVATLAES